MNHINVLYFGCIGSPGHGLYDKSLPWSKQPPYGSTPWGSKLDGFLVEPLKDCTPGQVQHAVKDGWTLVQFWDYSVDQRPGSNSAFLVSEIMSAEALIEEAQKQWPEIFNRPRFPKLNFGTVHSLLANDSRPSAYELEHAGDVALDNDTAESASLINEVTVDDRGWAVIPFGDWPHEMGLQQFHREQAQEIVDRFSSMAGRFRRAIVGLPIFKGHPDHAVQEIANQYPDKEEKGHLSDMELRPEGLALKLVLSNAGAELVRRGWKYISPYWLARLLTKAGDAMRVYAPSEIRSIGLVVRPNIPSPSLANAARAANQTKTMNPETLKLLGLAPDAKPEQIDAAIKQLQTQAGALANEQSAHNTLKATLTARDGEITTLKATVATLTTEKTAAETTLANERTARIDDHVSFAIRTGRATEAEKATWAARLKANFSTESAALANAAPKVKTASDIPAMLKTLEAQMRNGLANIDPKDKAGNQGGYAADDPDGKDACGMGNDDIAKMTSEQRGAKIKGLVNEQMTLLQNSPEHQRYNQAYANAKRANPRLFGFTQKDVTGS